MRYSPVFEYDHLAGGPNLSTPCVGQLQSRRPIRSKGLRWKARAAAPENVTRFAGPGPDVFKRTSGFEAVPATGRIRRCGRRQGTSVWRSKSASTLMKYDGVKKGFGLFELLEVFCQFGTGTCSVGKALKVWVGDFSFHWSIIPFQLLVMCVKLIHLWVQMCFRIAVSNYKCSVVSNTGLNDVLVDTSS